jgi:hypothetical protein
MGVVLETNLMSISWNAILVRMRLTNSNVTGFIVDVEIDAGIDIDPGNGVDSIESLEESRGCGIFNDIYTFVFLGRSYPLVTDVSTSWFGSPDNLTSNYWIHGTSDSWEGDETAIV